MAFHTRCPVTPVVALLGSRPNLTRSRLFFFSISLSRLFLPRQASVCHIVGMRLAPTSFETYAAELIERFSAGEEGDHMIYLSQRRPSKSDPAADEEAGKKKDDWNAGKTNNKTRAWSERQTAICSNVSVCAVVSDCGPSCVCAHAYEVLLIKCFFFFFFNFSCHRVEGMMRRRPWVCFRVDVHISGVSRTKRIPPNGT